LSFVSAKKLSVPLFAIGDEKSGTGLVSWLSTVFWFWPKPRIAKPCQRRSWFAPPNRARSAASIALRASIMVGRRGIITMAS
jgi:hypothetical protein